MNNFFKKDLKIKIISVLAALILWVIVYNNSNPLVTKTFYNIPFKIENEISLSERDIEIKNNYTKTVDITVRERKEILDKLSNSDFSASIDFSKIISEDDKVIEINEPICNVKGIKIQNYSPKQIELVLTKIKGVAFPVELIPNVTLKQNYKILKITLEKDTVMIEGEEDLVDSVGSVTASLDIKNLDRDISKTISCKVLNKEGKVITSLSRNKSVTVKVEVAKEVPVAPVVNGTPDADFVEVSRTVIPAKVSITGTPEVLAGINELKTEPVNLENAKKNINVTGAIKLPSGVKLADASKEVSVSIALEALAIKDLNIGKNEIAMKNRVIDGSLNYEIKNENILVRIKGRASQLGQLDTASIIPSVDLNSLGEGVHKIPLVIKLPNQVKLLDEIMVEIKVTKVQVDETV